MLLCVQFLYWSLHQIVHLLPEVAQEDTHDGPHDTQCDRDDEDDPKRVREGLFQSLYACGNDFRRHARYTGQGICVA